MVVCAHVIAASSLGVDHNTFSCVAPPYHCVTTCLLFIGLLLFVEFNDHESAPDVEMSLGSPRLIVCHDLCSLH